MTQDTSSTDMEFLANVGRALKNAEREEAKTRHGSNLAEYEQARRLGEGLPIGEDQFGDMICAKVIAVRDLKDNTGIRVIFDFNKRLRQVSLTWTEITDALNNPNPLYVRWLKELRSNASIVQEPQTVSGTARKVSKRKAQ